MGLIYNGSAFGNTPTSIATTLDAGMYGIGAYIQANYYRDLQGSIELFDVNYQSLGIYTTTGTAAFNPGNALFIGAFDLTGMRRCLRSAVYRVRRRALRTRFRHRRTAPADSPRARYAGALSELRQLGFAQSAVPPNKALAAKAVATVQATGKPAAVVPAASVAAKPAARPTIMLARSLGASRQVTSAARAQLLRTSIHRVRTSFAPRAYRPPTE